MSLLKAIVSSLVQAANFHQYVCINPNHIDYSSYMYLARAAARFAVLGEWEGTESTPKLLQICAFITFLIGVTHLQPHAGEHSMSYGETIILILIFPPPPAPYSKRLRMVYVILPPQLSSQQPCKAGLVERERERMTGPKSSSYIHGKVGV